MITSVGEFVQHLAGAERFFVTKVAEDRFTPDLEPGPPEDWAATRARLETVHRAEMARLATVPAARLAEKVGTEPPQIYGYSMEQVVAKLGASR